MTFLLLSLALTAVAAPFLRSSQVGLGQIASSGFNGTGVIIGFAVTSSIAALTSPLMGFGFIFAVLLHEIGAAKACQFIGHDLARVRLVPLPYIARPRSDHAFDDALEDSFAALYGPALAILPMVVSLGLFHASTPYFPLFAEVMRAIGIMIGTFNFVMLLPFAPFAGGRIVRAISDSFWPNLSILVTLFMVAAFATSALCDKSVSMAILAAIGLQSLLHKRRSEQTRLSPNNALITLSAYAFCLSVHFTGGWSLLNGNL